MTDTGICEVIITGPEGPLVTEIAQELVAARLAASANVFATPVQATYWWQGTLHVANETRAHLLTRVELVDRIIATVQARHPYEIPNVTAIPITAGNAAFIAWVMNETVSTSEAHPT